MRVLADEMAKCNLRMLYTKHASQDVVRTASYNPVSPRDSTNKVPNPFSTHNPSPEQSHGNYYHPSTTTYTPSQRLQSPRPKTALNLLSTSLAIPILRLLPNTHREHVLNIRPVLHRIRPIAVPIRKALSGVEARIYTIC